MAFCKKCGTELELGATQCEKCGTPVQTNRVSVNDQGGFLWGLLGFCIPLVGLILFLIWKDEKPNTAKSLITGAAIGFALGLLGGIFNAFALAAAM